MKTSRIVEVGIGERITDVCEYASDVARESGEEVKFELNGTEIRVRPGDSPETLEELWRAKREADQLRRGVK